MDTGRITSNASAGPLPANGVALKRAILIGVADYDAAGFWLQMNSAHTDVGDWSEQLGQFGFDVECLLTREQTTRTSILSKVRDKCFQMPPRSVLLIVFAGHGVTIANQQWLVPSDAPAPTSGPKAESLMANYHDYLLPADFRGAISETEAEHTLLVIDACRTELPSSSRREAAPFGAVPSRPNQRVILVHAAIPGEAAFDDGERGFLSTAMIGAMHGLGQNAKLSEIFKETDTRLRKKLEEVGIDQPAAGLRVQCEWGPNFDVWGTQLFAAAPDVPALGLVGGKTTGKSSTAGSMPVFDIEAFRKADPRERRALAYEFLSSLHKLALDAVAGAERLNKNLVPADRDDRVYEDDDNFLDFNFWAAASPLNTYVPTRDCFWYFLSLSTSPFKSRNKPSANHVEIDFGAVLTDYGLHHIVRKIKGNAARASVYEVAEKLGKPRGWRDVRENDFGNLQIEIARFSLADLIRTGGGTFFDAFKTASSITESRILKALPPPKRARRLSPKKSEAGKRPRL